MSHFQVIFPIEFLKEICLINSFLHNLATTGVGGYVTRVDDIVLKTVCQYFVKGKVLGSNSSLKEAANSADFYSLVSPQLQGYLSQC